MIRMTNDKVEKWDNYIVHIIEATFNYLFFTFVKESFDTRLVSSHRAHG